jgi:hypothetical protein
MQILWDSKSKNNTKIYLLLLYKWYVFRTCDILIWIHMIYILTKFVQLSWCKFGFKMWFCVLNMNIQVCNLKKMFHLFVYLRNWIHTNFIHINHNTIYAIVIRTYENEFHTNLWNLVSLWCNSNFLSNWVHRNVHSWPYSWFHW